MPLPCRAGDLEARWGQEGVDPMDATADKVLFFVNVSSIEHDGRWITHTKETGIVTEGATREESEALAAEANTTLVRGWKEHGLEALHTFFRRRGIEHEPLFNQAPAAKPKMAELERSILEFVTNSLDEKRVNKTELPGESRQLGLEVENDAA